jgi:REP element-mobilizing transposase RayT
MPNAPKGPRRGSISAIMAVFKSESTKRINALRRQPGRPFWKKGYYEHVIREYAGEYERIAQYIAENPMKWK